jgi:heme o synthase
VSLSQFRPSFTLIRVFLSLAVTFSAFTAWVLSGLKPVGECFPAMAAVFLFAAGASVLNQFQERDIDSRMERTMSRLLPSGRITPALALVISILLMGAGSALFLFSGMIIPLLLGCMNLLCYNGIYTPLKRKTPFALIPGALTGAIPVFMGWSAAGGNLTDTRIILFGIFMFLWQIPHFWLLMLNRSEDYKAAEIPLITDNLDPVRVRRVIMVWILSASLSSLILSARGFPGHFFYGAGILALNVALLVLSLYQLIFSEKPAFRFLFLVLNAFLFLVLLLLLLGSI